MAQSLRLAARAFCRDVSKLSCCARSATHRRTGRWKAEFVDAGRVALAAGRSGPSSREGQQAAEVAELTQALGEAAVQIRVWRNARMAGWAL
jgi:hypothetical protein